MQLFDSNHKTPAFSVIVHDKQGEKNITQLISDRLISLTLTDNRGFEADQLDISLSDHDGTLQIPRRGAEIELAIGWKNKPLVEKGRFTVDEVEFSGAPDQLTFRARSADMMGSLLTKQERSFDNIRIGALIEQLAKENGLKPLCGEPLKNQLIAHLDQTNESTINLLTRLAEDYDAIATVKNGHLLFIKAGQMKTASGQPLPEVQITRHSGDSYRFSLNESDNYSAVRAYWYNLDTGKKGEVVIDENSEIQRQHRQTKGRTLKDGTVKGQRQSKRKYNVLVQTEPVESDANQMKTLRHSYKTEAEAMNAAKAAYDKLKRGVASFALTLAVGNPELMPELPAILNGFKPQIDSTKWIVTKVTHSIGGGGYTTAVEFELDIETN
ncbi:hypothetical protein SAMN05660772_02086 [Pasteurella testudinis DSM 23072]|uniref:Phage protein D n=1 Tax=Pasteurella testudinis DSM 23072 TaxID=1122938 RepID=A0A1W1UMT1_9PAST|nr:phage late control D family protein [Pasteurella testudinis]SMB82380.1 hypothetical protein SAMN05660772_02086 [Pasteurella testudinis DSM 23072]SUB52228.1 Phage protein D [Pasteurella testudinis]